MAPIFNIQIRASAKCRPCRVTFSEDNIPSHSLPLDFECIQFQKIAMKSCLLSPPTHLLLVISQMFIHLLVCFSAVPTIEDGTFWFNMKETISIMHVTFEMNNHFLLWKSTVVCLDISEPDDFTCLSLSIYLQE